VTSCRTYAVANQKGGVAKTTTVACLATALHELGKRVLAVDLAPQACLTFSLGLDPENLELSIHDVLLGRVSARMVAQPVAEGPDVLPSTIDLAGCEYTLRHALDEIRANYDVILLDCAPTLGVLTINALTAADEVIVPLQCETLSHRGVGQLLDTVNDVQRLTNPALHVMGVLPTLFDGRTLHTRAVLADIALRYGLDVLDPPIPRSIRFAEAPAVGQTVMATAKRTPGAEAYRVLARRIAGLSESGSSSTPAAEPAATTEPPPPPSSVQKVSLDEPLEPPESPSMSYTRSGSEHR
jgi:chromosome partitioning protein